MVDCFTRTIRSEPDEAVRAAPAAEAAATTNRAAWPTGPLPLFAVVSDTIGVPARYAPAGETVPDTTPNAA